MNAKSLYAMKQYERVMGCPLKTQYPQELVQTGLLSCMQKIRNGVDVEDCHELIFILCALGFSNIQLDMKSMLLILPKITPDDPQSDVRVHNGFLSKAGFPTLTKEVNGYSYPYATARQAARKVAEMILFKCLDVIPDGGPQTPKDACDQITKMLDLFKICAPAQTAQSVQTAQTAQSVQTAQTVETAQTAQTAQSVQTAQTAAKALPPITTMVKAVAPTATMVKAV
jgi:hypothetical protein